MQSTYLILGPLLLVIDFVLDFPGNAGPSCHWLVLPFVSEYPSFLLKYLWDIKHLRLLDSYFGLLELFQNFYHDSAYSIVSIFITTMLISAYFDFYQNSAYSIVLIDFNQLVVEFH